MTLHDCDGLTRQAIARLGSGGFGVQQQQQQQQQGNDPPLSRTPMLRELRIESCDGLTWCEVGGGGVSRLIQSNTVSFSVR